MLLAVASIERLQRRMEHGLENIGHAQCLARRGGQGNRGDLKRVLIEINRPGRIGRDRAGRQHPLQQPGERSQHREEQHRHHEIEEGVVIGDRPVRDRLERNKPRTGHAEQCQPEDTADGPVQQIPDRQTLGRRIAG